MCLTIYELATLCLLSYMYLVKCLINLPWPRPLQALYAPLPMKHTNQLDHMVPYYIMILIHFNFFAIELSQLNAYVL